MSSSQVGALADRPVVSGVPILNSIVLVAINGRHVDALDGAGNFFSIVEIRPGQNVFEVTTADSLNQTTTNIITIYGSSCPDTFSNLGVLSASTVAEYGRTSFNEQTKCCMLT